ncbi:MAG: hypothetical protein AAF628_03100 [Planctomycetota bacterium]
MGDELAVAPPKLDGAITGETKPYPKLWGFGAQHGIAGPRLVLMPGAESDSAWGVVHELPDPARFTIQHLPPGAYELQHHMYETGYFAGDGAFATTSVVVESGATIDVGVLSKPEGRSLQVSVRYTDGTPAQGHLSVRDRMYESWEKVLEYGSTLTHALDPIPRPPVALLDSDGGGTLDGIASGRFEFRLQTPAGDRVDFVAEVEETGVLEVELEAP